VERLLEEDAKAEDVTYEVHEHKDGDEEDGDEMSDMGTQREDEDLDDVALEGEMESMISAAMTELGDDESEGGDSDLAAEIDRDLEREGGEDDDSNDDDDDDDEEEEDEEEDTAEQEGELTFLVGKSYAVTSFI
jgi:transcription initiation factor TFIID subunit 7